MGPSRETVTALVLGFGGAPGLGFPGAGRGEGVNALANKTSKKSAKIAKKAPAKRVAAKAAERPSRIVDANSASRLMDQRIRELGGWRGEILARMRTLILQAAPDIVEECKWIKPTNPFGVPVWSHAGIVCTGEAYAKVVKLTFARGATIPDPSRLFNSSLEGKTRRAIDIHEGEKVNARAFKALVKAAVAQNDLSAKKR